MKQYQQARKLIERHSLGSQYKLVINSFELTHDQLKGIEREGRAFGYLSSRFSVYRFRMSTPYEDSEGTDIVGENNGRGITYQVGGARVKECNTNYYLQVTEKRIYMRNGTK